MHDSRRLAPWGNAGCTYTYQVSLRGLSAMIWDGELGLLRLDIC